MSSILEALRELETERPPKGEHKTTVTDAPSEAPRGGGATIPLAGGLAIGIVVFAVWAWRGGLSAPATGPGAPAGEPAPAAAPAEVAAPPSGQRPAWLDAAEAPKARVASDVATTPERAAPAPSRAAATEPVPPATSGTRAVAAVRSFQLESVAYEGPVARRSVTLRVNGERVTLREGESTGGIVVQLITPDGAYLQRGGEVFLATPAR